MFFSSSLIATGTCIAGNEVVNAEDGVVRPTPALPWVKDPLNPKRSDVRVTDAEKLGYSLSFVTYLTRFLLNFDPTSQQWWIDGSKEIPKSATKEEIFTIREEQFAKLAASVEIGLQGYGGTEGPCRLLESLLQRFGNADGISFAEDPASKRLGREYKEARRQIALLFGLLAETQPTKLITRLLASIDNGSLKTVVLDKNNPSLRGFSQTDLPVIDFAPPQAGLESFLQATGKPVMKTTGQLLKIGVLDEGSGYVNPPKISLSPPSSATGRTATAIATISKGAIQKIELTDRGAGYSEQDIIAVQIDPSEASKPAKLKAFIEMEIAQIKIENAGTGYAVEKPVKILLAGGSDKQTLLGFGSVESERSSFKSFRQKGDNQVQTLEKAFDQGENGGGVSATSSGGSAPSIPFAGKASSSRQLLALLPQGFGLVYDNKTKRYELNVDKDFQEKFPTFTSQSSNSNRPLVPDFGPRGLSPIERDMNLDVSTFLRFCLSGAICSSGVHLALTPLDVVKTKIQTKPEKYATVGTSFQAVWKDEGPSTFFTGWLPTVTGYFLSGAVLYAVTEAIRRYLTEAAGVNGESLEAPIILAAAGISAAIGSVIFCPFEAVRIRSVAQPDFGNDAPSVLKRLVREEGIGSLTDAIPVFLAKNVPYAMVKFTIFDLSTEYLYDLYPVAQEDLILSLGISLAGGVLAGISAAIISNPADAVVAELKKEKSDKSPQDAFQALLDRGGVSTLFKGLPIRMVFYSLTASLQFLVFDVVRFSLDIGPDDMKLYLDVLGGAISQPGTIA